MVSIPGTEIVIFDRFGILPTFPILAYLIAQFRHGKDQIGGRLFHHFELQAVERLHGVLFVELLQTQLPKGLQAAGRYGIITRKAGPPGIDQTGQLAGFDADGPAP